jgi:hypothetical protein
MVLGGGSVPQTSAEQYIRQGELLLTSSFLTQYAVGQDTVFSNCKAVLIPYTKNPEEARKRFREAVQYAGFAFAPVEYGSDGKPKSNAQVAAVQSGSMSIYITNYSGKVIPARSLLYWRPPPVDAFAKAAGSQRFSPEICGASPNMFVEEVAMETFDVLATTKPFKIFLAGVISMAILLLVEANEKRKANEKARKKGALRAAADAYTDTPGSDEDKEMLLLLHLTVSGSTRMTQAPRMSIWMRHRHSMHC